MPAPKPRLVVFVHGWSVSTTGTYGEFPARLQREAQRDAGLEIDIENVWLGKYVSFRDSVRVEDLARGFQAAVRRQLARRFADGQRFVCITHSTGGPVIREWWERYYAPDKRGRDCPMSHFIMLAPANFGSALAQLGKGRISKLKSWVGSVEPGTGVLDWLELGSPEAWTLNQRWMEYPDFTKARGGVFPFVLTGQMIDRALYDHVNSYTGENGSDGVVRAAAANLNATYVKLRQKPPTERQLAKVARLEAQGEHADAAEALEEISTALEVVDRKTSRRTAFGLVKGRSHSGEEMGILRSVKRSGPSHPSVSAVLKCLRVSSSRAYATACREFEEHTAAVERRERVEVQEGFFRDSYTIHDPYSMVIFRLVDDRGHAVTDFDLKLTGGPDGDPDNLPTGFFQDRQRTSRHKGTVTYYLNHARMTGAPAVPHKGKTRRPKLAGATHLGIEIIPRPRRGYAHYAKAVLRASTRTLADVLKPHQTTLVDIELRRIVHEGVFLVTKDQAPEDFRKQRVGDVIS